MLINQQLEKKNEEYEGLFKDDDEDNNNNIQQEIKILDIQVNFKINDKIETIDFKMKGNNTIKDIIKKTIQQFNESDYEEIKNNKEYVYSFNEDSDKYLLKPSKKNKMPKDDYPPFNNDTNIENCDKTRFYLFYNEKDLECKEKISKDKKDDSSCNCVIF